ncbi:anti-sigma factor family protein [Streptomyces silvisoli]|uniref:Zf-HC2 domain-containing protein n=1 Tax=Streptomyces silvisoli TaxID=3034235 RepID=A0ABT5ZM97_9ACTN|nr:zf-HC2 domain-containing protein [Streptomyces silvisoli]MDF3290957.1 zf-HC2 domain-containing protein [Streptomyces silvisoli]
MTSTASTDEHPEVSEISAFAEGILPPERTAALRGHLADCVVCTDVRDSLDEIRNLLGSLPGPSRMPADVAERIDAALAAEALINATAPDSTSTDVSKPARAASAANSTRVSRETAPSIQRPAAHAHAATGPGRARPRRRRGRTLLAAASAAAVLALGGLLVSSLGSSHSGQSTGPATTGAQQPGMFSGAALPTKVHELLNHAGAASPKSGGHAEETPFATQAAPAPSCVLRGTGRAGTPLALSRGTYDGHAAYLIVLPHPADPARVDAFVVDASCDSTGSATPGHVLTQQTYNR